MKHINAVDIAAEADKRYSMMHVAETSAFNTMSV